MTKKDAYYDAILARDPKFDGKFFIGVKTTRIYCRPICPARPNRQNIEIYPSHWAAEKAGYKPCLRCRPESAPLSPVWIGKSAIVQRAVKMIHHQDTLRFNEEKFAGLFGVSARHLRRVFVDEVGKTPKQLSFENRLNLARKLIVETSLPITEVVYASGFNSIRRFNDAFKERFRRTPSEIRRSPVEATSGLRVSIPYRPPFDFEGLLESYRLHRIGDLEWYESGKMTRVIAVGSKVGTVTIVNDPAAFKLWVEIRFPDTSIIHQVICRVRHLFDLDSDPVMVANSLEQNPALKKLLKKHPGIRLPSGWDGFEVAIAVIVGQLVTVDFGRQLTHDLINLLGRDSGLKHEGRAIRLFPTAAEIAASDLQGLKTTAARKKALREFCRAIVEGRLSLEPTQDVDEFIKNVTSIPGIGPWSASYMALKVLRHADAFPDTDLILKRALELHAPDAVMQASPWRGYVAALFWREYAQTLKKTKKRKTT